MSTVQHTLKSSIRCIISKLSKTPNRIQSILIKTCPPLLFIYKGKISSSINGGCSSPCLIEQQKQLLIFLFTSSLNFLLARYTIKANKSINIMTVKHAIPYMTKLYITLSIFHLLDSFIISTVPTKYYPKEFLIFS